jgi:hypothetical protein
LARPSIVAPILMERPDRLVRILSRFPDLADGLGVMNLHADVERLRAHATHGQKQEQNEERTAMARFPDHFVKVGEKTNESMI